MIGMVSTAITEFTAVRVMFSATSPWARWLYRLALVPPGEAASSISPTASAGARAKPLAMKKQATGRMRIWQTRPMITGLGYFTTRAKSASVSDNPRPSMMMPRAAGRKTVSKGSAVIVFILELETAPIVRRARHRSPVAHAARCRKFVSENKQG